MVPEHVHDAGAGQGDGEQLGPLLHHSANQEAPVRLAHEAQRRGRRVALALQVFGCRDEVVEHVLFLLVHAGLVPGRDEPPLLDYSRSILAELRSHQVRAELDSSTDHIKAKIANAEQMKVHTMLVIGKRDMDANAVSVRVHGKGNLGAKPRAEVVAEILESIRSRTA